MSAELPAEASELVDCPRCIELIAGGCAWLVNSTEGCNLCGCTLTPHKVPRIAAMRYRMMSPDKRKAWAEELFFENQKNRFNRQNRSA